MVTTVVSWNITKRHNPYCTGFGYTVLTMKNVRPLNMVNATSANPASNHSSIPPRRASTAMAITKNAPTDNIIGVAPPIPLTVNPFQCARNEGPVCSGFSISASQKSMLA